MRKILLFLVLLFAAISSAIAQKLIVESFKLVPSDLTAQTQPRKDLNNRNCALIKVGLGLKGVQFEGNIIGNVENKTGEYWVYMPQGNSMLKVKHADYAPLMVSFADYGINRLESNRTYLLSLLGSGQQQAQQYQTLTIKYTPSSATVLVDNKIVKGLKGVAQTTLPIGQHSYVIACEGYDSEEGIIKLKATTPSNLQIALSKDVTAANQVFHTVVAQQPVGQTPIANSGNITIPVKDGISIEMVRVEAGTFTMGAASEMKTISDSSKPAHQVTLTNDFYIGKYEVTQALWQAVMGNNPSEFKGNDLPVENVSWYDCQDFISKLNAITGRKFRLPTEAEWEFAARGGNKSRGYLYSGSNKLSDVAWYNDNSGGKTHKVGTKQPNELGIYDMSGNVWEWCHDWDYEYNSSPQVNPTGATNGSYRLDRGGCWGTNVDFCLLYHRSKYVPRLDFNFLGFRLVLSD